MENELIKVTQTTNGELLVSARDLHKFLEINTKFQDWFKRMLQYGFEENIDYTKIEYEVHSQKRERTYMEINYALKIDMAKEVAMIQRNEKGKQIRKYFIECEKQLKSQVPQLSLEQKAILQVVQSTSQEERMMALSNYKEVVTAPLVEKIEKDAPKVEYHDKVLNSNGLLTITEIASDLGLSAQKLNKLLHEKHLIYKKGKTWHLYDEHKHLINDGCCDYFISEFGQALKFTEKGRKFIIEFLKQ